MYDRNDLEIRDNRIVVKEYTGTNLNGVPHFNWKTLITLDARGIQPRELLNKIINSISN